MKANKNIKMHVWETSLTAVIYAVQGESEARDICLQLIDIPGEPDWVGGNAQPLDKPLNLTDAQARLYVTKPDGAKVFVEGEVTDAANGKVKFTTTTQMLACPGLMACEIRIDWPGGRSLKVQGLQLDIQPSDMEGAVESTNEFSALSLLLDRTNTMLAACTKAAERADAMAQTASAQATYAGEQGDYAKEQAVKLAEAFPNLNGVVPPTQLYQDFTVSGRVLEAKAGAFPLKSCKLFGPLAAGKHVVEVHGKNWFNVNLSYTNNNAYSTVTRENDTVTVVTNSAPAGFYDIAFPNVIRVKPNTEYTLSVLLTIENTQGNTLRGDIRIGDNDNTLIKFLSGETKDGTYRKSTTFTTPASGRVRLALRYHNTGALALVAGVRVTWAEIMLSEGALAYTPYTGKWYDVTVDQRLAEGESVEVENVMAVDGTNILLNSANAPMEATFAAAIPEIQQTLTGMSQLFNAQNDALNHKMDSLVQIERMKPESGFEVHDDWIFHVAKIGRLCIAVGRFITPMTTGGMLPVARLDQKYAIENNCISWGVVSTMKGGTIGAGADETGMRLYINALDKADTGMWCGFIIGWVAAE